MPFDSMPAIQCSSYTASVVHPALLLALFDFPLVDYGNKGNSGGPVRVVTNAHFTQLPIDAVHIERFVHVPGGILPRDTDVAVIAQLFA
jgi:hypothetical protein